MIDRQLALALPHRHVGHVVLERLELSDGSPEGPPDFHIVDGVLEHAVEHSQTERGHDDALVVETGQDAAPSLIDVAQHQLIGHEHIVQKDLAGADRTHTEFGDLSDAQPFRRVRHQEERHAAGGFVGFRVGVGEKQQIV